MRIRLVVAVAASTILVGCGAPNSSNPSTRPTGRYTSLHLAVCEASLAASAGDEAKATESFENAHGGLHDVAAAAEARDRAAAARLLEAKQVVESDATAVAAAYMTLLTAVEDAIEATGDEVGKCPE